MNQEEARQALGDRIRELRKEQNLTIRTFGLMIGLSKDYIVDIEFGRKSPTLDTIVKIAAGLGITPSELLRGIGESEGTSPEQAPARDPNKNETRYHSTRL